MKKEEVAAKWASGVFACLKPEHQICNGEGLRDTFLCAINEAVDHQEKRIAELETQVAERDALLRECRFALLGWCMKYCSPKSLRLLDEIKNLIGEVVK